MRRGWQGWRGKKKKKPGYKQSPNYTIGDELGNHYLAGRSAKNLSDVSLKGRLLAADRAFARDLDQKGGQ